MVRVVPKNDDLRKLLKHPSNNVPFPAEGSQDWPDDSFTHRRITDGDVAVVEEKTETAKAAPVETKAAVEVGTANKK